MYVRCQTVLVSSIIFTLAYAAAITLLGPAMGSAVSWSEALLIGVGTSLSSPGVGIANLIDFKQLQTRPGKVRAARRAQHWS